MHQTCGPEGGRQSHCLKVRSLTSYPVECYGVGTFDRRYLHLHSRSSTIRRHLSVPPRLPVAYLFAATTCVWMCVAVSFLDSTLVSFRGNQKGSHHVQRVRLV